MIKVEREEYNHFNQECSTDSKLMERRKKKGETEKRREGEGKRQEKKEERGERGEKERSIYI